MANTFQIKRSAVAGKVPLTSDLALGELAINTYDGKLYLKRNVNGTESIVDVSAGGTATDLLNLIKTVDGAGSGLDADLLDGLSSGSFFRSDAGNSVDARLAAADGRGLRFWDSDSYKIWMSAAGNASWGGRLDATSDYNMYFRMTGGTNRGFVFMNNTAPVFQIESNGQVRAAGPIIATGFTGPLTGNASTATTLQTARTIALSGAATGTATSFNGSANITIPVTGLNASNLNAGTVPDACLSGVYSGITLQTNGGNTHVTTPNSGSPSTNDRTVFGLAQFKSDSSAAVGAIVFIAPNTNSTIMHRLKIEGMLYAGGPTVCTIVQGYRTTGAWSNTSKLNLGITDLPVRFGVTPDGKNCVILGDVGTSWSYPMLAITHAMFSHSGVTDAYCKDWTVDLVTDLSLYTNVTASLANSVMHSGLDAADLITGIVPDARLSGTYTGVNITGNAATATTLQTARTIALSGDVTGSVSFNGSANVTITTTIADDSHNHIIGNVDGLQAALDAKAALASPALTGTPTAPTAAVGTNTTQLATTAFVQAEIANDAPTKTGGGASGTWAINITGNAATATSATDSTKLPLAGGTATGTINAPTFNATSLTGGGFQGIDADTATNPSFTWTADLDTGMYRVTTDQIGFTTAGVNRLTISSAGIAVAGDVQSSSDARLKTNVARIENALEKLLSLQGVTYDRLDLEKRQAGVIAQDVEQVLPEVVGVDHNGLLTVAYGNMISLVIEAIRELKEQLDAR